MQDKEHCSECQQKFDGFFHAPRDVGCGPNHYMCLTCLKNHLNSEQRRIECYLHEPQDKIIDLKYKTMTDFPVIEFSKTKTDQTFCSQHGNMNMTTAKFICMDCPAKICLPCSQEHMKTGHDVISIAEIASRRKEIENSIMNKFDIIEEAKLREKDYADMRSQFEKSLNDESEKCIKEFQNQINFIKSNISTYLSNVHRGIQNEFAFLEKDFGPWRDGVLENVSKYSNEDPELALRNLYKEQKDRQYKVKMSEYEQKMTKQIQAFQKEREKISINFFQRFSDFIRKELFTELNSLGKNNQQEEKRVGFNMENGYKAFNQSEALDPRSSIRNQMNQSQVNQRERGRSKSKGPRDNRGRSGSKNKNKFEENKLSDSRPATSHIRRPSNSSGVDRSLGLDHIADSLKKSLEDFQIPLTVKNDGGLIVKTVNTMHKSSINNDTANLIQQFFGYRSPEELQAITQVEFICSGMDGPGMADIGNTISSFKNLTSLSIKFVKSEDMNPRDLTTLEKAFTKLDRLKTLRLSFARWRKMTDKALLIFIEKLNSSKSLKTLELDFSGCFKLRDEGVNKGVISLSSLENLEKLLINLAECSDVTYNCTDQLRGHFDRMQSLKQARIDFGKGTPSKYNESFHYERN